MSTLIDIENQGVLGGSRADLVEGKPAGGWGVASEARNAPALGSFAAPACGPDRFSTPPFCKQGYNSHSGPLFY